MYFSRATLVSALAGFATAQSAVMRNMMASESLKASVAKSMPMSSGSPSAAGAAAGMVNTHVVQVGGSNGSLTFLPNNVVAQPGDLVQFQFHPKNHSVVQSTFDNPCVPIQNIMANKTDAFFSGFMPTNVSAGATSKVLTYTIHVKDAKPIWFYCSQAKHCQSGMVGAINAPPSGKKTMAAFIALAATASENLSPGQAPGSSGGAAGKTPPSPSSSAGAGTGSDSGSAAGAGTGSDSSSAAGSSAAAGGTNGTTSSAPAQATANSAAGLSAQSFLGMGAAVAAIMALL
ncbi:Cupredoxin [Clathrospora elynae]|uniref:Cupredoxin n=1 Tax=Clathrospora elynae TaxID=706981 RepID=A0A6A5T5V0_9PLEO|nr:Cupredoxin [Clathrospora elynae]